MDQITKGFLDSFLLTKNIKEKEESKQFELFVNYYIISNEYDGNIEIYNTITGKGTQGIDGIGIIVNNKLCYSVEEIKDIFDMSKRLDVTFLFTQSKTSGHFDGSQILNFFNAVKNFFSENSDLLFTSDEMKNFMEMKEFIYDNSQYMKTRNPICKLYFATTGTWILNKDFKQTLQNGKELLDETGLFEDVMFESCDRKKLQSLYRRSQQSNEETIKFERKVSFPTISGIKNAYIGLIPFLEFKKLIINIEDDTKKLVFDDNIRDFLQTDKNLVNKDIQTTLQNKDFDLFSIYNNGVTVVAEKINTTGDNVTITNYQIVNGCQTSNVLYENRKTEGIDTTYIPLKIIETTSMEIKNNVTRATNNQTQVSIEELESTSVFQKELEGFYDTLPNDEYRLYYERRTNQYKGTDIEEFRIVDIENQVKSYSAIFLENPHIVSGYYGKITKTLNELFDPKNGCYPYYLSSIIYFTITRLYREKVIPEELWRFRYHISMMFRIIVGGEKPKNNGKKIENYCIKILNVLKNENLVIDYVNIIIKLIFSDKKIKKDDRKVTERKITTDILVKLSKKYYKKNPI